MADDPLLLRQTVLDTTDARGLAEFYRELLGLAYRPGHEPPPPSEDDPDGREWLVLRNPGGNQLAFQQVEELTPSTWREHARALALGARLLRDDSQDDVEPIYVYADPAGHPFCIFVAPAPEAAT